MPAERAAPVLLEKAMKRGRRQCDLEIDPLIMPRGADLFDVSEGLDNSFGKRKSDGEIFKIEWARHHDGMSDAAIVNCQWNFFGDIQATPTAFLVETMQGGHRSPRRSV